MTGDIISENVDLTARTYSIYTFYFLQAELRTPFDPLLVDFLYKTRLHISQLTPNLVRTILEIVEINRRFGAQLDFWDTRYCYAFGFSNSEGKWNLKGRTGPPTLVLSLWDFCKYVYNNSVIIKGNVEPDPSEHPVPKHLGSPGSKSFSFCLSFVFFLFFACFLFSSLLFAEDELFKRPKPDLVHADQLNAIVHHTGLGDSSQLNHPRAANNLLGYVPDCSCFIERTAPSQ